LRPRRSAAWKIVRAPWRQQKIGGLRVKFIIEKSQLADAMKAVSSIIPGKSAVSVLNGALIKAEEDGRVTFAANNLEAEINFEVSSAKVDEPGFAVVPAKEFYQRIRNLSDGEVTVTSGSLQTTVEQDGILSTFVNIQSNEDDFPSLGNESETKNLTINSEDLKRAIKVTSSSMNLKASNNTFRACHIVADKDSVNFYATSGHKVAKYRREGGADFEIKVPVFGKYLAKIISPMPKNKPIEMQIGKNLVSFVSSDAFIRVEAKMRIFNARTPDFESWFQTTSVVSALLNTKKFVNFAKAISANAKMVRLSFADKFLELRETSSDGKPIGFASVPAVCEGNFDRQEHISSQYLKDVAKAINDEELTVSLSERKFTPVSIVSKDGKEAFIICPMRVQE
jgi:DNA polymerase III sliding clamp (beta) subunit (PCNA family)